MSILAAEYTSKGRGFPATLHINKIVDGRRWKVIGFNVSGKREARELAQRYGAKPWNF